MTASNMGSANSPPASADLPKNKPAGNCGPMCQQSPLGAHGYDMHPQEFVRLIGSSDKARQKPDTTERLH